MTILKTRSGLWRLLLLCSGPFTQGVTAHAEACEPRHISVQAASTSSTSNWQEFDAAGLKLVQESGALRGTELTAVLHCESWEFQGMLSQTDGTRSYEGFTSTGVAATSQSSLRESSTHIQAMMKLSDAWAMGLRLSQQTTWRDIASTPSASGYPERFEWSLASLGARWSTSTNFGQLTLEAWTSAPIASTMFLQLPGRDPTTLPLGPIRHMELGVRWNMPLDSHWVLLAEGGVRRTDIAQSADVVIFRSSVPVGVAHQPRTSVLEMPVSIGIQYTF